MPQECTALRVVQLAATPGQRARRPDLPHFATQVHHRELGAADPVRGTARTRQEARRGSEVLSATTARVEEQRELHACRLMRSLARVSQKGARFLLVGQQRGHIDTDIEIIGLAAETARCNDHVRQANTIGRGRIDRGDLGSGDDPAARGGTTVQALLKREPVFARLHDVRAFGVTPRAIRICVQCGEPAHAGVVLAPHRMGGSLSVVFGRVSSRYAGRDGEQAASTSAAESLHGRLAEAKQIGGDDIVLSDDDAG
jgi:hypothetical protein